MAVLGIISFSLVISLAPLGSVSDAGPQLGRLAEYKGEPITTRDLERAMEMRFRGTQVANNPLLRAQMAPRILDDMLFRRAGVDEAQRLSLSVSDGELADYLRAQAWLNENGQWVGGALYRERVETQFRMSVKEFEESVWKDLLLEKLRWIASDGIILRDEEILKEFHRLSEQARIDYVTFDPSQYIDAVKVEPEKLITYFATNRQRYQVPEQRSIRYVLIEPDRVREEAQVSDDDLRRHYREHLVEFRVQERVQVAHILFRTLGNAEEETALVEARAAEVLERVRAGGDFARLAEQHSEDATATVGGDLGWVYRGQTVKEFEDAAFSLEPGAISDLIKTTYGLHILKVGERQEAHLEVFEQVRERLRPILEGRKLSGAMDGLARRVERAMRTEPQSFEETAARFELELKVTKSFRKGQAVTDLGTEPSVHDTAFRLRTGEVSRALSVPKGRILLQVAGIVEASLPEIEQVRTRVEQDYRAGESGAVARAKAQEFAQSVKNDGLRRTARRMGLRWERTRPFTRNDFLEGIGSASSFRNAFTLEVGESGGPVAVAGSTVVYEVFSRQPAPEQAYEEQKEFLRENLLNQKRGLAFELYRQNLFQQLERTGKLIRYPEAMQTYLSNVRR